MRGIHRSGRFRTARRAARIAQPWAGEGCSDPATARCRSLAPATATVAYARCMGTLSVRAGEMAPTGPARIRHVGPSEAERTAHGESLDSAPQRSSGSPDGPEVLAAEALLSARRRAACSTEPADRLSVEVRPPSPLPSAVTKPPAIPIVASALWSIE
jgi:hypothetical protein